MEEFIYLGLFLEVYFFFLDNYYNKYILRRYNFIGNKFVIKMDYEEISGIILSFIDFKN